jgi:N-acetyl-gamma-glutamyl-phosphate reductase
MARPKVFIDGDAATTGLEIRARLDGRGDIDLVSIAPGERKDAGARKKLLNAVDLAVLCLPDAAAREAVELVENPAVRVLDASSSHRIAPGWVYGFPELAPGQSDLIKSAKRVTNPGCYSIGAIALLRPLVDAGLLPPDYPLAIHAVEGYSGGGRQLVDAYEGNAEPKITDPYRIYAFELQHKHVPEIERVSGLTARPIFWPSYGAWRQGMLLEIPLHLGLLPKLPKAAELRAALAARYAGQRFVTVMPEEPRPVVLSPEALNGTNRMELFVFGNDATGQALLVARADNLGKGASGSAAQNIDLMLGLAGAQDYALAAE